MLFLCWKSVVCWKTHREVKAVDVSSLLHAELGEISGFLEGDLHGA